MKTIPLTDCRNKYDYFTPAPNHTCIHLLKIARDYILTILEYGFSKFQIMFGGEK